jgi:hypothetical protein
MPAPTVTGEIQWDLIGSIDSASVANGGGEFSAVGFEDGYVLLDMTRTIQFSSDGVTWTRVRLPVAEGSALGAQSAATDGARVLLVGSYTPCRTSAYNSDPFGRCRGRPASWLSDDGLTWLPSDPWAGPIGPKGQAGSDFVAAWSLPTGAWEAAQALYTGDESDEGYWIGPALWRSEDAREWTMLREMPAEPSSMCDPYWLADAFWAVADVDGRRVAHEAFECEGGGAYLSMSLDGQRYERIETFPGDGVWVGQGLAPVGSGSSWLWQGGRQVSDNASEALTWASDDLVGWTTTVLPVTSQGTQALVWALAHGDVGYVATGLAGPAGGYDRAVTWMSAEGTVWRIADTQPSKTFAIEQIMDGPAGMLGLGSVLVSETEDESTYMLDVWRLKDLR